MSKDRLICQIACMRQKAQASSVDASACYIFLSLPEEPLLHTLPIRTTAPSEPALSSVNQNCATIACLDAAGHGARVRTELWYHACDMRGMRPARLPRRSPGSKALHPALHGRSAACPWAAMRCDDCGCRACEAGLQVGIIACHLCGPRAAATDTVLTTALAAARYWLDLVELCSALVLKRVFRRSAAAVYSIEHQPI